MRPGAPQGKVKQGKQDRQDKLDKQDKQDKQAVDARAEWHPGAPDPDPGDYSATGAAAMTSRATIFSRMRADLPERPRM